MGSKKAQKIVGNTKLDKKKAANADAKRAKKKLWGKKVDITKDFHDIKNKIRRQTMVGIQFTEKKKLRSKARRSKRAAEQSGQVVEREIPRTIERLREQDETIVPPDDEEVQQDEAIDEFASYFDGTTTPKIMITTTKKPSRKVYDFLKELIEVIPNAFYYKRGEHKLKDICKYATNKKFTDLMVFSEDKRGYKLNGVYMVHLPKGPTSYWKLTNLKLGSEIKGGATCTPDLEPELILNNFTTRLGQRCARQIAALFPQKPNFRGRRVVTFHNQRDFLFFRHHRYQFRKDGTKCGLQEIGPRFTLKMRYMQHGTFDSKEGEYEFVWRPDSQVKRNIFAM